MNTCYGIEIFSENELKNTFQYYIPSCAFVYDKDGVPTNRKWVEGDEAMINLTYLICKVLNKFEYEHLRDEKFKNKIVDKIKNMGFDFIQQVYLGEPFKTKKGGKTYRNVYVRGSFKRNKL